jgi:biotin carboxyl carrier protein
MTVGNGPVGETLAVPERMIVAPTTGIFRRLDGAPPIEDGAVIHRGDVIGAVQTRVAFTPVQSPFEGLLVTILAFEGERLRQGQPVAWLRCRVSASRDRADPGAR